MKDYYVGLDIGTNSVGVACTDTEYRLMRAKRKNCWCVRLFDEAKTAKDRRVSRTTRRRLERRKKRILLLQSLFAPFMEDNTFFIRLNNSGYYPEDKDSLLGGLPDSLFGDKAFRDMDYHKKYPTVFHLRKALTDGTEDDLRLYYLALHHIVKYRGHFLFEGTMQDIHDMGRLISALNQTLEDRFYENTPVFDIEKVAEMRDCLMNGKGMKEKQKSLEILLSATDSVMKEIIKALTGGKFSPEKLFGEEYKEEKNFSFSEYTDETFEALQEKFTQEDFSVLEAMRAVYNYVLFEKILDGESTVSGAMIKVYNRHKEDLSALKQLIHTYCSQEDYNKMFKATDQVSNYVNYIGYTKKGGDKKKVKVCKYEDFLGYLKKNCLTIMSDEAKADPIYIDISNKVDEKTFLPKILHADNGLFPHQVNEDELEKIVASMVKRFPETAETAKKIKPLFLYRIPYYVGPLTGKNGWMVKKEDAPKEKITPWNFDDIVDRARSNEAFMRRMTNKCSYLHGEDVLPKGSILYQEYNVLNQINKLRINEEMISVELKQAIYSELFLKYPKVTDKKIIELAIKKGLISEKDAQTATVSGKDGELGASMSSYLQLKKILGDFVDKDLRDQTGICEKIILWCTLNTDKNIVCSLLLQHFGDIPEIAQNIKRLKGLNFKDFGRLSEKFLNGLYYTDESTGECLSIIDLLYQTNENLNEILFNERYGFQEAIRKENGFESNEITDEDIKALYVSPAVRRGIHQTLKIIDEYIGAIGYEPKKIFVEVTREDDVKGDAGRKNSRKKQLLALYQDVEGYDDLKQELKSEDMSDMKLRSERYYLYFRQLGRCMYSGERIDLSVLSTDQYDVDHIYPRSDTKDDSLNNKVLVLRKKNADKTDIYPIPRELVSPAARAHWEVLYKKKLLSEVTYKRLKRTEPLTEEEKRDFLNRQKVITDQTTKAVAELLARKYPNTRIVYSKAKNVSEFKQKFDLFKCRETNDLHHARDAYLNIVVGNVFDVCRSMKKLFENNISDVWVADGDKTISQVKKVYADTSMQVTKMTYCQHGAFYNETVYPKGSKGITAPRKGVGTLSDTEKYGGFKKQTTAYFAIVRSVGEKGKTMKTIEAVPVLVDLESQKNPNRLQEYFSEYLTNPEIIVPKVKVKQLISYNGSLATLAGITGNSIIVHNATQLFTDGRIDEYIQSIVKLLEMDTNGLIDREKQSFLMKTNRFGKRSLEIEPQRNIEIYDMLIEKLNTNRYCGLSAAKTFCSNIEKGREKFLTISTYQQAWTIMQILRFFKCNAEKSNLSLVGGSAISGTILINKDIADAEVYLIFRSPTGLYERRQKI